MKEVKAYLSDDGELYRTELEAVRADSAYWKRKLDQAVEKERLSPPPRREIRQANHEREQRGGHQ